MTDQLKMFRDFISNSLLVVNGVNISA